MAKSTEKKKIATWQRAASIALIVLGLAATTAIAANVTQAPTISGTAVSGTELTASTGAWTPAGAKTAYDWLRCNADVSSCTPISGACGRRYQISSADEGNRLVARLTVTDSAGQAASANSAPTDVVVPKLPPPYNETVPPGKDTCTQVTITGPGQGTFISGVQTGGGSTPVADTTLKFIDPFPVIRIAGRFKGKRTTLKRVTVRAPRGTRIQARCSGRGCPWRRKAAAVRLVPYRSLQGTYRPKATIEFRVTQPGKIGKYTRVRTRRGKAPVRLDRCLMPGETQPVKCPSN